MTLLEIVQYVDDIKPNAFRDEQKLLYLNELEYSIQANVWDLENGYAAHESLEEETLLPTQWAKVYYLYLQARIALDEGEYNEYANLMQIFNGFIGEYERWYARHNIDTN